MILRKKRQPTLIFFAIVLTTMMFTASVSYAEHLIAPITIDVPPELGTNMPVHASIDLPEELRGVSYEQIEVTVHPINKPDQKTAGQVVPACENGYELWWIVEDADQACNEWQASLSIGEVPTGQRFSWSGKPGEYLEEHKVQSNFVPPDQRETTQSPVTLHRPQEIAARVADSVVLLVMQGNDGQPLALGSGFVVLKGVVATNMHVLANASGGYAKLAGEDTKYTIRGIVSADPERDLAMLSIAQLEAEPLPITDSNKVEVADTVYAVGNPQGLEGTFSPGIISGIRHFEDSSLLQITAPISPGSSGGPVVNKKGEVIGVAVGMFHDGQNLNFAIPSQYLIELLPKIDINTIQPLSRTSTTTTQFRPRSMLGHLGERRTDGVEGTQFMWHSSGSWVSGGMPQQFSFSLRNNLQHPVSNISIVVIFYGDDGGVIDNVQMRVGDYGFAGFTPSTIMPGMAIRVESKIDGSVRQLATYKYTSELRQRQRGRSPQFPQRPQEGETVTRVEFRIINFDIVRANEAGQLSPE